MRRLALLTLLAASTMAGGCAYHRIRDIGTGKEYVTRDYHDTGYGGVRFTDLKTGREVQLQSWEREKIPDDVAQREINTAKN